MTFPGWSCTTLCLTDSAACDKTWWYRDWLEIVLYRYYNGRRDSIYMQRIGECDTETDWRYSAMMWKVFIHYRACVIGSFKSTYPDQAWCVHNLLGKITMDIALMHVQTVHTAGHNVTSCHIIYSHILQWTARFHILLVSVMHRLYLDLYR